MVALKPSDTLSAKLLKQLDHARGGRPQPRRPAAAAPGRHDAARGGVDRRDLDRPAGADTSIALTIQPGGAFTWQVTQKGKTRQFAGNSTYGDGILTLVQDKGPALVGRVSWKDASHMTFRIVGDGPDARWIAGWCQQLADQGPQQPLARARTL